MSKAMRVQMVQRQDASYRIQLQKGKIRKRAYSINHSFGTGTKGYVVAYLRSISFENYCSAVTLMLAVCVHHKPLLQPAVMQSGQWPIKCT